MPRIDPAYLEHQRKHWMRPDAYRFIRPDWRRFARPGFENEHPFALYENKYRPDQARVPPGSREGGQWTDEEVGGGSGGGNDGGADDGAQLPPNAKPTQFKLPDEVVNRSRSGVGVVDGEAVEPVAGRGHHYVPTADVLKRGISSEAVKVFDKATTGPLLHPRNNLWDNKHRAYNQAVGEALDAYLAEKKTTPGNMTADQAKEFIGRIHDSKDMRIRSFNYGIEIRERAMRVFRRGGRE